MKSTRKKRWSDYLWIAELCYLFLGLFNILFAWLGMIDFLLPLFGAISDKTNTKLGRRTPFIIAGTLAAAIAFVGLSFVDNAQARALNGVERFETAVYGTIADADAQNDDIKGIFDNAVSTVFNNSLNKKLITPNGVEFVVMNEFAIPGDNDQSETEKMISVRDYLAGEAEQTALNAASVAVDRDFFCAIENYYSPVDVDNTDNRPVQPSRLYSEFYVPARPRRRPPQRCWGSHSRCTR